MPKFDKPKLNKSKLNQSEFDGSQSNEDSPDRSKSLPLAKLPPVQLDETIVAGRRPKKLSQLERLLMEMPNFHLGALALPVDVEEDDDSFDFQEFESRICKILNAKNINVNVKKLAKYLEYLKQNIKFPCRVTGRDEFLWEEEFVFGGGSKKQYEKLKKNQPSYTDSFAIAKFEESFDTDEGIVVKVQRLSDNKEFRLPLVDLEASDKNSPNYQLLDDYSTWFANY